MKKIYIIFLFSIISFIAFSQTAQITDHHDNIINYGDTVIFENDTIDKEHVLEFKIKNTSSGTLSYMARKIELSLIGNSSVFFCFVEDCFPKEVNNSTNPMILNASQTSAAVDFSSHYQAYDFVDGAPVYYPGTSYVAYTIYDNASPADSMYFVIQYTINNHIGIKENKNNAASVKVYPNPATDCFIVDYKFENATKAEIQIINILGSTILNQEISTSSNNAKINISELNSGVYFYNIIVDGNNIVSKKLIVK